MVQGSRGGVPQEPSNKRKASEGQQEHPEKKNKNQQEERGSKRSVDDWEMFAKKLRTDAEQREDEDKKAKVGEDLDNDVMIEEIGAVGFAESDLKHDEAVEKFINQLCEETFGEYYDAMTGEVLGGELIEAREVEVEPFKRHGQYEKVPLEVC